MKRTVPAFHIQKFLRKTEHLRCWAVLGGVTSKCELTSALTQPHNDVMKDSHLTTHIKYSYEVRKRDC